MNDEYQKAYLYRQIVQAKLYIDQHYAENIDVQNIAYQAHFSKFHFLRLFKSIYGKTPHQYSPKRMRATRGMSAIHLCA